MIVTALIVVAFVLTLFDLANGGSRRWPVVAVTVLLLCIALLISRLT